MEEYIDFASRNYLLFITLAAVITLIIITELRRATKGFKEVSPSDAVLLINKEDALVLDVREANELSQGNIVNAKHIAFSSLTDKLDNLASDKDKPILVFCKMGTKSSKACQLLLKNSYTNVFGLKGGITAWINEQLPIIKK